MRRWFQLRYMGDALPVTAPLALVAVFDTAVKRATRRKPQELAQDVLNILKGIEPRPT